MMTYKGYTGKAEFDDEAMVFHGTVLGIKDVITFEADNTRDLVQAFHDSVDDYLEFCKEEGRDPARTYSGKFNARLSPDIHRRITIAAKEEGISLNTWLNRNLQMILKRNSA
jgi:predicted HicB family RNase H-like nuclease